MYWQIHTIENDEQRLSLHAYLAGGKALSLFLHKASFSLQQKNIFYLTTKFVENIEKVPPTQSEIKVIINQTI